MQHRVFCWVFKNVFTFIHSIREYEHLFANIFTHHFMHVPNEDLRSVGWQLFSPLRHIWQLHISWTVVQRQGCMETRALPDLRLRQWNRHVRWGDLWGYSWLRRPHHPRGRVLPYLSRCWGYLHPPSLHQFCGFISLAAPPSAPPPLFWPSTPTWPWVDQPACKRI